MLRSLVSEARERASELARLALVSLSILGCGSDAAGPIEETPVATTLTLSATVLAFSSLGAAEQLTAIVRDQNGATMSASVAWASSASSVASVTSTGLVSAVASGLATITASSGTAVGSAQVTVLPLVVSGASPPDGVAGDPYSHALSASGGDGNYTWALTSGALPIGTSLSPDGIISGTPTVPSVSTFSVQVVSGDGQSATGQLTVRVYDVLQITTAALPSALVNTSYSVSLAAFGGESPYTWSVTVGSLPDGLSLSPSPGSITGTPTVVGSSTLTLEVRSANGKTASAEYTLGVYSLLIVTTASLEDPLTGNVYNATLAASGGDATYTWSLFSGQLPSGLTLSTDGTISGTPLSTGFSSFTVQVTSGDGQAETRFFSFNVYDPLEIITASLPSGVVGQGLFASVDEFGGAFPYSWSVLAGTLPDGLALNASNGTISGTPTTAGSTTFTLQVQSGDGQTATREFTVIIYAVLTITTASLPDGSVGAPYNQALTAVGGSGGYIWSVSTGPLPSGLSLSTDGIISGTPTSVGLSGMILRVASGAQTDTQTLFIQIN